MSQRRAFGASALASTAAIMCRQTNVVWAALLAVVRFPACPDMHPLRSFSFRMMVMLSADLKYDCVCWTSSGVIFMLAVSGSKRCCNV